MKGITVYCPFSMFSGNPCECVNERKDADCKYMLCGAIEDLRKTAWEACAEQSVLADHLKEGLGAIAGSVGNAGERIGDSVFTAGNVIGG